MTEAALQDLVVRMAADPAFADQVRAHPEVLDEYDLTDDERLAISGLGADPGAGAEGLGARQSKSVLLPMGMGGAHHPDSSHLGAAPAHPVPAAHHEPGVLPGLHAKLHPEGSMKAGASEIEMEKIQLAHEDGDRID